MPSLYQSALEHGNNFIRTVITLPIMPTVKIILYLQYDYTMYYAYRRVLRSYYDRITTTLRKLFIDPYRMWDSIKFIYIELVS